jgi:hypothetical protein
MIMGPGDKTEEDNDPQPGDGKDAAGEDFDYTNNPLDDGK